MTDDATLSEFLSYFRTLAAAAENSAREASQFSAPITEFLGADPLSISIVGTEVSEYRYADWNRALDQLASDDPDARVLGVAGGENSLHLSLSELIEPSYQHLRISHPEYLSLSTGPGEITPVLSNGVRLFHWGGGPLAVLQRRALPRAGLERAAFQVLSPVDGLGQRLLDHLTATVDDHSYLRGKAFHLDFDHEIGGTAYRFLERPEVPAENVILPDGVLEKITHHVIGIAEAAQQLLAHGQHLKRGVLLYGPPGTGKTHTVKHLLSRTPDHTVVMLRGMGLMRITEAAELARRLQPSIVVLEDCDLVAEDRSFDGSTPLLFQVLDAVDGLDTDVDVTFLLTTNRVEVLEEALAQRPGRVDLAVEIPLPDEVSRRRLLELYRGDVEFSGAALDETAAATQGQTASFSKELIRRAVLAAILAGETPGDGHLLGELDRQLAESETLRENMAATGEPEGFEEFDFDEIVGEFPVDLDGTDFDDGNGRGIPDA